MMYNLRLVGGRLDRINLRVSLVVIAIFTVITIISYFYELSRAGLLSKQFHHPHFPHPHRETREAGAPPSDTGPLRQLGLQIDDIKEKVRLKNWGKEPHEINIAVHLDKNDSYAKVDNTSLHVYQHQNTHPNFYISACSNNDLQSPDCVSNIAHQRSVLHNATQVLLYQHEPGGYFMRECFKQTTQTGGKVIPSVPMNAATRQEWDHMSAKKKKSFSVLYGGLTFGVCETVHRPCVYITLVPHPVDRILSIYDICSRNQSSSYCKVNSFSSNISLDEFIRKQGNNLFHKLLYNYRHCKLLGADEICLPDSTTSFVLSQEEKEVYLEDIVKNLEKWFGVIGLTAHLEDSLNLFQAALDMPFSKCLSQGHLHGNHFKRYTLASQHDATNINMDQNFYEHYQSEGDTPNHLVLKGDLLEDPQVRRWLYADLVIYQKLQEIFHRQLKAFHLMSDVKGARHSLEEHRRKRSSHRPVQSHLNNKAINHYALRKITTYDFHDSDSNNGSSRFLFDNNDKYKLKRKERSYNNYNRLDSQKNHDSEVRFDEMPSTQSNIQHYRNAYKKGWEYMKDLLAYTRYLKDKIKQKSQSRPLSSPDKLM